MIDVSPAGSNVPFEVTDLVASWAPSRRWYPGAATDRPVPWLEITLSGAPDVVLCIMKIGDILAGVPLVLYAKGDARPEARMPGAQRAYIGSAGNLDVYDGGRHPLAWQALLEAAGCGEVDLAAGHVIAGEQSNTSVALPQQPGAPGHPGVMLKLLRTITPGTHPDVLVPRALQAIGYPGIPAYLGTVEAPLPDGQSANLCVLSELIPDSRDGFEYACGQAQADHPIVREAAALGRSVAALHVALRRALPVGATLEASGLLQGLRARAAAAVAAAPTVLSPLQGQIAAALDSLEASLAAHPEALTPQHIHGDLHLGQMLLSADDTWYVLDFEGEPGRPVTERTAPDLPLRDVAGMLRSFDYAAAVGQTSDPGWARAAQEAFWAAYRTEAGTPDKPVVTELLRAFTLDKALYEVVYEARHRPHWVHIPLAAIEQLLANS